WGVWLVMGGFRSACGCLAGRGIAALDSWQCDQADCCWHGPSCREASRLPAGRVRRSCCAVRPSQDSVIVLRTPTGSNADLAKRVGYGLKILVREPRERRHGLGSLLILPAQIAFAAGKLVGVVAPHGRAVRAPPTAQDFLAFGDRREPLARTCRLVGKVGDRFIGPLGKVTAIGFHEQLPRDLVGLLAGQDR